MKRSSYRENDYRFGQTMLTLRAAIGLTQAGLAEMLGVSRQSVAEWESGGKYPKFNHLQAFIALAVQHHAFSTGHEAEEIRALWKASHQKVLLDERWLVELFDQTTANPTPAETVDEPPQPNSPRLVFNNLPFQPTPFIGRADELNEIATLLHDPACRLLTLLGTGGIGKTRLAIELASRQAAAYADGVVFVGLASISDAHQLTLAVGDALNLSFVGQANPVSYLLAELRERNLLLILDNFEHLLAGITLVNEIISNAPQITVLVTSRERLRLRAEWLFEVGGLAYPTKIQSEPQAAEAAQYSAVQLFIGRVRQIQPRLPLAALALNSIVQICQYVEGMPLAIELAAASTYTMPLLEVEQRIRLNLDTLSTHFYDASPRQRSLRATFDYSWDLLNEPERLLFSRLAVFRGGCTPASAEQVAGATPALFNILVNKSLLRQSDEPEPRFTFLEPLREYALEKLAEYGEMAVQQKTHARYFLALAQAAPGQWGNTREDEITVQLDREHDNLRAALRWARDSGETTIALQLGMSLWRFWRRGGYISEGRIWLEDLLALDFDSSDPDLMTTRLRLIEQAAWLAADQNDYKRSRELFEQARTLRRKLGEAEDDIAFLANEAFQARAAGNYRHGIGLLEDTIARHRALGNEDARSRADMGHSLYTLGMMLREGGQFERAAVLFEEGVQSFSAIGDREAVAQGLLGLSDLGRDQGDPAQVRQYCEPALPIFREFGTQWAVGFALINLGLADYLEGNLTEARTAIENALTLFRTIQNDGALAEGHIALGVVSQAQGDLTAAFKAQIEALQLALEIGPRLVVAMALDGLAATLTRLGQFETAVQCLAVSSTLRDEMNTPVRPVDQPSLDQAIDKLQSTLGDAFIDMWSSAATFPPESICDKVLGLSQAIEDGASAPADGNVVADSSATPIPGTRVDWDNALAVDAFYGREWELRMLTEWVVKQQCRVITVLGLGGIGKSALAIHFMRLVADEFEIVIWRSLRDLPTCDVLLVDLLQILIPEALSETAGNFEARLQLLMEQLRAKRVLVVLDNVESVLQEGEISGRMRPGYEGFGRFLTQVAGTQHRSMILLTTRQKPDELLPHEGGGAHAPVRTLRLVALDSEACEKLLSERAIASSPSERTQLIQTYAGNPLALKIVAQTIADLFSGEITPFLGQGGVIFGGVHDLLHEQFKRLSPLEQRIAYWLTIMREPITFTQLQALFVMPLPANTALDTMNRLYRHSLIERGQSPGSFTLQSVVLEYLTEQLIIEAADEILSGDLNILIHYGLEQAQVKDYVRRTQNRLLIVPLLKRLQSMGLPDIEAQIDHLLNKLRGTPTAAQGYAPANFVALLKGLRGHLNALDLSGLALRGVHFQGIEMRDSYLSRAYIRDCEFNEAFDGVVFFTISANGQYWAASSQLGEVRLWEAGGYTLCRIWPNTTDIIYRIALSPDGQTLVGGTANGVLKAWDTTSGTLRWTAHWPESISIIYQIAFSPDGSALFVRANDEQLRLLNATNGQQFQIIPLPHPTTFTTWNRSGSILAGGDRTGTIRLWAINQTHPAESAVCIQEITAHNGGVRGLGFSPDDRMLVSAGADNTGKFWNAADGQLIRVIDGHVVNLRLSPDGDTLAITGRDNVVWLRDVTQGHYRAALQHTAGVMNMLFTPDGQNIVTISQDGTIQVWEVKSGERLRVMQGFSSTFKQADWSPDGRQLMAGCTDHTVTVFSVDNEAPPRVFYGHNHIVYSVRWNPNGEYLASAERGKLRLWEAESGECRWVLQNLNHQSHSTTFYDFDWSPDGQRLAVGTDRYGIMIWDMETQQFREFPDQFPTIVGRSVAWNPDGTYVAATGENRIVYIWNAEGELAGQLSGHQTTVENINWGSDDARLVSVSADEIIVWDMERYELLRAIEVPSSSFTSVVWAANEQVVTGSVDGVLRWWDLSTGQCLAEIDTTQGAIQSLSRSPDRTKLASCGSDGAITIWDLHTGEHLRTLRRDRPYERTDITGIRGLTEAQKVTLRQLGAVEMG